MRVVMFYHSLVSDWNHGNAHFLRGIATALLDRGDQVRILEPQDGWSRAHLLADQGPAAIEAFHRAYPRLQSETYQLETLDLDAVLEPADLVIVHEWNVHELVARIGEHHAAHPCYALLFHDTHHRSVTDAAAMAAYDLRHFDGVLAFGDCIRDRYLEHRWIANAWTWHEAADTRLFRPQPSSGEPDGDIVWIGNWGDDERSAELEEFLIEPVRALGVRATVYGVRYPDDVRRRLADDGIAYGGWLPNYRTPDVFARHTVTVHIPRRPYLEQLPGVPTIRPFEALACGIPLVAARWDRTADLFTPGEDYLVARDGAEMTAHLDRLLADQARRLALAAHGRETILARHTCEHRVGELYDICDQLTARLMERP